jgi:hypothetical protein
MAGKKVIKEKPVSPEPIASRTSRAATAGVTAMA